MFNSLDNNNVSRNQNPYLATQEDYQLFARLLETKVYTDIETKKPHVHFGPTFSTLGVRGIDISRQLKFMNDWLDHSNVMKSDVTERRFKNFQSCAMVQSHQSVIDSIERERLKYTEKLLNTQSVGRNSCAWLQQDPTPSQQ